MMMSESSPVFNDKQFLTEINQIVSLLPEIEKDSKQSQEVIHHALETIKGFVKSMEDQPRTLNKHEVTWIGISLLKLHKAFPGLINKSKEFKDPHDFNGLIKEFNKLFNTTLKALLSDPRFADMHIENKDLPFVKHVFNEMLFSIRSDAHEEVIGQERPMGSLPSMILTGMLQKRNLAVQEQKELREKVRQVASALYPIAILSATADSKSPVPSKEQEQRALMRDERQYVREYESQFGTTAKKLWSSEFFNKCLQAMWENRRGD
jgi:hypothetical protein